MIFQGPAAGPLCYIFVMRDFLWRYAKATGIPALLLIALFAVFWGLAYFLRDPGTVKLAAAVVAAGLGLLQAESICRMANAGELGGILIRLIVAAIWVFAALGVSGTFLTREVGGGAELLTRQDLQALRGAVARYRAAHHDQVPASLPAIVRRMPTAWLGHNRYGRQLLPHEPTDAVEVYGKEVCRGSTNLRPVRVTLRDTGRWGYISDPTSPCAGIVFVDCTHTDFSGRLWAEY